MLEGLDDVAWQQLHHAYGSAEDVPELLRALSRSGEDHEEALGTLFGNIWHQGTVYEASPYAVPFLVELAAEPTVTRRGEILGLVGALANGKSYLAVHAQAGLKIGEFFRQKPDFETRLEKEQEDVRRTRIAVFEHRDVICRLLKDANAMVRAGAAHVLSRFPEHASKFGPLIRQTARDEVHLLARAGMLRCLGALRDLSPEATDLLDAAVRESTDPRQAFAAAIALYQIRGEPYSVALPLYRQLAAARWFAEGFLVGLPWDSSELRLEPLFADVEPDPAGATRTLLLFLSKHNVQCDSYTYAAIVHDLLELNFSGGKWRECKQLTITQKDVLRRLVESEAVWKDAQRLWFLMPVVPESISQLTPADIQTVRDEMRLILGRSGIPR